MRGPLPLSEDDFADVRARVLAKVARPRVRLAPWFAFAASVVVAVLSFLVARVPAAAPLLTRRLASPSPHVAVRGTLEIERPTPRASGQKVAEGRIRGRSHKRPKPAVAVARMEIQTADPDVRIIWITN